MPEKYLYLRSHAYNYLNPKQLALLCNTYMFANKYSKFHLFQKFTNSNYIDEPVLFSREHLLFNIANNHKRKAHFGKRAKRN